MRFRNIKDTFLVKKSMLFCNGEWKGVVNTKHKINQKHSPSLTQIVMTND